MKPKVTPKLLIVEIPFGGRFRLIPKDHGGTLYTRICPGGSADPVIQGWGKVFAVSEAFQLEMFNSNEIVIKE